MCKALSFFRDDVYFLIVYRYIKNIVRSKTIWLDAFSKYMEEPLTVIYFYVIADVL